jgi:hypothetical protein
MNSALKLFEEIDDQNEGRNAEKFATNFQNNPEVKTFPVSTGVIVVAAPYPRMD